MAFFRCNDICNGIPKYDWTFLIVSSCKERIGPLYDRYSKQESIAVEAVFRFPFVRCPLTTNWVITRYQTFAYTMVVNGQRNTDNGMRNADLLK